MTDLERVRRELERQQYALGGNDAPTEEALDDLDAHLKKDAERDRLQNALPSYYEQQAARLQAELTELREHARKYEKMWAKQVRQLAELREAVRMISEAPTYDSDAGEMCFVEDTKDIARQLIEGKP